MYDQLINELNNRKLDSCLISIYAIPTKIHIKEKDGDIKEKEAYLFLSCNIHGVRKFICCIFTERYNRTSEWYDFFGFFKKSWDKYYFICCYS